MTPAITFPMTDPSVPPDGLKFDANGLIPVVAQDAENGEVLMVAWMNAESLRMTLQTRRATYWSRSRQELWIKGLTSGHFQTVREVRVDCDADCLLLIIDQEGTACHTGARSCFYRHLAGGEEEGAAAQPSSTGARGGE